MLDEVEDPERVGRCEVCFEKSIDLNQHICTKQSAIKCDYCSELFESIIDLGAHLNEAKHPTTDLLKCDQCTMAFPTASLLQCHQRSKYAHFPPKDEDTYFECYICKMKIRSMSETMRHIKQHVVAQDKKCELCKERLTSNEIDGHLCAMVKNCIKCEYCNSSFNSTIKVQQHLDNEHSNDKILRRCRKCTQYFEMEILRDIHEKWHDRIVKTFSCDICDKKYVYKALLKKHTIESHSDESM